MCVARISGLVVVSFIASSVACSSSEGTSSPSPASNASTDDAGAAAEQQEEESVCAATLTGDCAECMKTSCCDSLVACEEDADCLACVTAQDSDACERTSETHERVDHYLTCKGGDCRESCIGESNSSCAGLLKDLVTDACATCMETNCCDEVSACKAHDVCWDGCFTNHNETKCHGSPDGHALFHALGTCATTNCSSTCQ